MTRLQANLCLFLTAFLWGMAFIAQKTGMEGLGPSGFTGIRFALSALLILPFALREKRKADAPIEQRNRRQIAALGVIFFLAVVSQQAGMMTTSITNAGFLTGLYVVFVPFFAWAMFRRRPDAILLPACLIAVAGVWLLGGGSLKAFTAGDWLVLASAFLYGLHIALLGLLVQETGRPLTLALVQYSFCAGLGLLAAFAFESGIAPAAIQENMIQILYAGLISGGIAYTLQAVAQRYAPPSHAAIIMLMEAPFAALGGAVALGDRLSVMGWAGCIFIFLAAILAESAPLLSRTIRPGE